MITEYHRPNTLDEALALLARENPPTLPLGGGTVLNAPSDDEFAVVDLQNLGLDAIESRGSLLDLGATVTLQQLLDTPMPPDLHKAIRHEATHNLRQVGTVAGTLVAADGRSPFAAAMIALDPTLTLLPGGQESPLGDLLHSREYAIRNTQYALRFTYIPKRLITRLTLNTKPT
ncbi:MAG: FAD binding domain-containing protein, partial [Anaerolineales bacterium]